MTVINIFDIWQKLMSAVNVQQGGQIRPQVDFENWYNEVSSEMFHEKVQSAELNQRLIDELSPFLVSANIVITPAPGMPYDIIRYPLDYEGYSNCKILRPKESFNQSDNDEEYKGPMCGCDTDLPFIDVEGNTLQFEDPDYAVMAQKFAGNNLIPVLVNKVDNQRWEGCMGHKTKGPTFDQPKITQYAGGFKISPKGLTTAVLDYYRTPARATFVYTVGTGDIVIYNSSASVQLEWSNIVENEFLTRLCKKYGLYVQDDKVYQMANNDKKELV